MKLFYCFVAEMVISQPIGKRFEGSAFEKLRIELPPPIMDEIYGIEMTEIESISINGRPPPAPQPCHLNYCSRGGWESLDSNDGTGDHESFK